MGEALDGVTIVAPTLTVDETMTLDIGGRKIVLTAWRTSHSDCDLTCWTSGPEPCSPAICFSPACARRGRQPASAFSTSPNNCQNTRDPRRTGPRPMVAPWPKALDDERAYLTRLTSDLRAGDKERATMSADAARVAGQSERGGWRLFDDYNGRNATAASRNWNGTRRDGLEDEDGLTIQASGGEYDEKLFTSRAWRRRVPRLPRFLERSGRSNAGAPDPWPDLAARSVPEPAMAMDEAVALEARRARRTPPSFP